MREKQDETVCLTSTFFWPQDSVAFHDESQHKDKWGYLRRSAPGSVEMAFYINDDQYSGPTEVRMGINERLKIMRGSLFSNESDNSILYLSIAQDGTIDGNMYSFLFETPDEDMTVLDIVASDGGKIDVSLLDHYLCETRS